MDCSKEQVEKALLRVKKHATPFAKDLRAICEELLRIKSAAIKTR